MFSAVLQGNSCSSSEFLHHVHTPHTVLLISLILVFLMSNLCNKPPTPRWHCTSGSLLQQLCSSLHLLDEQKVLLSCFRMKEHFFLLNPIFVASSRDRGWRTIRSNTNIEPCLGLSLHNRKKMKRKLKLCQRQHANYHLFMHLAQHFPVSCQTCRYRFVQSLHCGLISLTKEPFHHADTVTGNTLNSSVFSSHEHPKTIDHNQVSANSPWKNMLL